MVPWSLYLYITVPVLTTDLRIKSRRQHPLYSSIIFIPIVIQTKCNYGITVNTRKTLRHPSHKLSLSMNRPKLLSGVGNTPLPPLLSIRDSKTRRHQPRLAVTGEKNNFKKLTHMSQTLRT